MPYLCSENEAITPEITIVDLCAPPTDQKLLGTRWGFSGHSPMKSLAINATAPENLLENLWFFLIKPEAT